MTTVNHTPWTGAKALTNANLNETFSELDSGIEAVKDGSATIASAVITNAVITALEVADATELTIASGAVTRTQMYHNIDTEGDASSDDLTDINGGSAGDLLVIRANNAGRTVVVIHDAAKIFLAGEANVSLDEVQHTILLIHDGTRWIELKSPSAGGGGAPSYAKLSDVRESGTGAGDPSGTTTWVNRDVNTENHDADSIVALSANLFTPISGTYRIRASFPAVDCGVFSGRLYNNTDTSVVIEGTTAYSAGADFVQTRCEVVGQFSTDGTKAFALQGYYQNSAGSGWTEGSAANIAGKAEVYAIVELWKVG